MSSYSYDSSKRELVSYDTPNIVKQKCKYISDKGLAGSMFWELSGDRVGAESLVGISASELGALDQTPNHISCVSFFYIVHRVGAELEFSDTPTASGLMSATTWDRRYKDKLS